MSSTKEILAKNIRKICKKKKITVENLAFDCDISYRHMGDILRAVCNTSVDMLDKISNGTNYRVSELVAEQGFVKYEYACVPVCKNVEYVGRTETFGIKLLPCGGNEECYFDDVSTDEEFVNNLVCVLNEHQVAPEHVKDVITDFLCEI